MRTVDRGKRPAKSSRIEGRTVLLWLALGFLYFCGNAFIGSHFSVLYGTSLSVGLVWIAGPALIPFVVAVYQRREFFAFFAIIYVLVVLNSWPLVMIVNVVGYKPSVVTYAGTITKKFVYGRYGGTSLITISNNQKTDISFIVSRSEFNELNVGDAYAKRMWLGRLGIPYLTTRADGSWP